MILRILIIYYAYVRAYVYVRTARALVQALSATRISFFLNVASAFATSAPDAILEIKVGL